jgi:CBS domain-containing protein
MQRDAALRTRRLGTGASIVQASPWQAPAVTPESPAIDVMTDLAQAKAATVAPAATLAQAEQTMIFQGVRMLFVVTDMPAVEGLVTATDLRGDQAVRIAQERHLRHDELSVADVMTPLARLDAIEIGDLRNATVSNVIATLQRCGRHHLLVVEAAPHRVRGVISRAQIERQLGRPIDLVEIAGSFAEIERALA